MEIELQSREALYTILAYSTGRGLVVSWQRNYHRLHLVTSHFTDVLGEFSQVYFNCIPKGLIERQPLGSYSYFRDEGFTLMGVPTTKLLLTTSPPVVLHK